MAEQPKSKIKKEVAIFDVKKFSIAQLPQLKTKKEEIAAIIKANPIVEIIDTETYEQAKKSRTAVKTLRTGTEKEQKDVKGEVKLMVLDAIDTEYDSIITGIKAQEKLRQDIVTAWETKKQAEKDEKARLEQERIDTIKATIDNYAAEWKTAFNLMVFDTIEEVGAGFLESYTNFDLTVLEEFESLFPSKIEELTQYLSEKTISLTDAEKSRSTKAIGEWYVAWGGKLFSMCIENAEGIAKLFNEQEKLNFPIQEFQEDFDEKFKEIQSQISAKQISLKKDKEEADNAAKKREKAQEEKEAVYKIRKARLLEIGLKYSDEHDTLYVDADSDFILLADDILEESALEFENTIAEAKLAIKEFAEQSTPTETPSPENLKGIESEEKALELLQNIFPVETDDTTESSALDLSTANICNRIEYPKTPNESIKPVTWDDIIEEFKTSGEKSYSAWLKANFNVPTKIN